MLIDRVYSSLLALLDLLVALVAVSHIVLLNDLEDIAEISDTLHFTLFFAIIHRFSTEEAESLPGTYFEELLEALCYRKCLTSFA